MLLQRILSSKSAFESTFSGLHVPSILLSSICMMVSSSMPGCGLTKASSSPRSPTWSESSTTPNVCNHMKLKASVQTTRIYLRNEGPIILPKSPSR